MTDEQYLAMIERVDAIADAVTARIESGFKWSLTDEEVRALSGAPGIAEAEAILAAYTPTSALDVRMDMVRKGIALAALAAPDMIRALNVGWDEGGDA